jgi:hypothetical protein
VADFDTLVTELRAWTKNHDPHVRAAVELLISDGRWLRRSDFVGECVTTGDGDGTAWIPWYRARDFIESSRSSASVTEMRVLEIAVAIGSDQYRLSRMNDEQAEAIVKAFAGALNVEADHRD